MATNFKNSAGTDLESIFEAGSGGPTTGFKNASNTDMGGLFLPVSSGSAASATGFKNSAGTDLGSLLCAKGTDKPTFSNTSFNTQRATSYCLRTCADCPNVDFDKYVIAATASKPVYWTIYMNTTLLNKVPSNCNHNGTSSCIAYSTTSTSFNTNFYIAYYVSSGSVTTTLKAEHNNNTFNVISKSSRASIPNSCNR